MVDGAESRKIVVPIQFTHDSTLAVDYTRMLARSGDEVILVHVIELLETSGMLLPKPISVDSMIREIRDDAIRRLEIAAEECAMPAGVQVRTVCLDGNAGEAITTFVAESGAWLVVMETAGKGAAKRMMLGSVADHVARSADCPVLLVRESEELEPNAIDIRRIVIPVDPTNRARTPLTFAGDLAMRLAVPVELVSVNSIEQTPYLYGTGTPLFLPVEFEASLQKATELLLNASADELISREITVTTSVLTGPIALSIEAILQPGDLIVMSSHGRSGIRRWLLGSVAEHLVRKGSAPVVLVPASELVGTVS